MNNIVLKYVKREGKGLSYMKCMTCSELNIDHVRFIRAVRQKWEMREWKRDSHLRLLLTATLVLEQNNDQECNWFIIVFFCTQWLMQLVTFSCFSDIESVTQRAIHYILSHILKFQWSIMLWLCWSCALRFYLLLSSERYMWSIKWPPLGEIMVMYSYQSVKL